jgi:hypothetical protein
MLKNMCTYQKVIVNVSTFSSFFWTHFAPSRTRQRYCGHIVYTSSEMRLFCLEKFLKIPGLGPLNVTIAEYLRKIKQCHVIICTYELIVYIKDSKSWNMRWPVLKSYNLYCNNSYIYITLWQSSLACCDIASHHWILRHNSIFGRSLSWYMTISLHQLKIMIFLNKQLSALQGFF